MEATEAEELPASDGVTCLDCECNHKSGYCSCKHTVTSSADLKAKSGHRYRIRPAVGMGVTMYGWSDRHSGTIVHVSDNLKEIMVQTDHAVRTDSNGMSECQQYKFFRQPGRRDGADARYTLRKNGRWVLAGTDLHKGQALSLGSRDEYYDFSF